MRTTVSTLVLLICLASPAFAAEPAPSAQKGRVLVLSNQHTLEGDIERVGDRYRVRRPVGETWVPAEAVLCLVASRPEAYGYLRGRANLEDPDERLRLANWCRLNGLREQAMAEVQAAAQLRPDHGETQRLLAALRHAEQAAPDTRPAPPVSVGEKDAGPPVEVTSESLGLFATRIQPILMNTCASCHATGRGGKFRLIQAYDGGIANRRTLERNLTAVLGQIDLNRPEASRLLLKAVSDHAHTGQAPLKGRTAAPYVTLEAWVKLTVANNPHLRDALPSSVAVPEVRRPTAGPATQWGADTRSSPTAPSALPSSPGPVPVSSAAPAAPPAPPPAAPVDPYDPEPFNRQLHPSIEKSENRK